MGGGRCARLVGGEGEDHFCTHSSCFIHSFISSLHPQHRFYAHDIITLQPLPRYMSIEC